MSAGTALLTLIAAALGATCGWIGRGRLHAGRFAAANQPQTATRTVDFERGHLVELCIDLADRLRDRQPALWDRLLRGLSEVGVEARLPDCDPYDVELHDAVAREATDDPARNLTVASTERSGFTDHGRLIRRAEVVVYRTERVP